MICHEEKHVYHERKFVFGACQSCKSYPESHAGRVGEKNTIYGRRKYDLADYFSDWEKPKTRLWCRVASACQGARGVDGVACGRSAAFSALNGLSF